MYLMRRWSTRNARALEWIYEISAGAFHALDPLWCRVGFARLERPFAVLERGLKGLFFDCRMCGRCVISDTGMTCPMTCPKRIRNGPCGGVRADGHCEVEPEMPCAWVEAWNGAGQMRCGIAGLGEIQPPVEHDRIGTSAWLRISAENMAGRAGEAERARP